MELFVNATFLTCEEENRTCSAMVTDKGHIVWIGDAGKLPAAYSGAKRIDLGGATVTPGFGDTHIHFESLCVFENTFYLMEVKNFSRQNPLYSRTLSASPRRRFSLATAAARIPSKNIVCRPGRTWMAGRIVR